VAATLAVLLLWMLDLMQIISFLFPRHCCHNPLDLLDFLNCIIEGFDVIIRLMWKVKAENICQVLESDKMRLIVDNVIYSLGFWKC
jgi:hypothetical protein